MILSLLSFLWTDSMLIAQNRPTPSVSRSVSSFDTDKDGIPNEKDLCPKIPGKINGCPEVSLFRGKTSHDLVFSLLDTERFFEKEKDEIRIGDKFSSGFYNASSGKIWNESAGVEVTQ